MLTTRRRREQIVFPNQRLLMLAQEKLRVPGFLVHFPKPVAGDLPGEFLRIGNLRHTVKPRPVNAVVLVEVATGNAKDSFAFEQQQILGLERGTRSEERRV